MQENLIMPKYGNSAPSSQKWNFSKFFHFFEKVSRFRFQRALNHPQALSLSQVMQENILSKKLNLGLNFSTPSGGVTSPLLKESMVCAYSPGPFVLFLGEKKFDLILQLHCTLLVPQIYQKFC